MAVASRRLAPAALLLPAVTIGALLALWEVAPRVGWVRIGTVPPMSDVIAETWAVLRDPAFAPDVVASATRWALGLGLAVGLGVPLGLLMGRSRLAFRLVDPLLVALYPVPKAALILIFVFWWGAGTTSRVVVITLAASIPVVIAAYHGAAAVEPRLVWSARALGSGRLASLPRVVLPAALPQALSGIRLALAVSLFAVLASELLIRQSGVGGYLFNNLDAGQNVRVWACAVIIAWTGFLLDALYAGAVKRFLPWLEGQV